MSARYGIGDAIPSSFDPGIVAGSYFASLCGCLLTVEILHRRGTALLNWRSWLETLACAISMGLVGIWCMHFIGNRAIVLGNGDPSIQLVYNSGFTVLSVVLPVVALIIAFSAAELPSRLPWFHWTALACTGIFAGLSIVGMHYLGNFGVSNYVLQYSPKFLAASIIIAIGDCLTVLVLFYSLREKWISSWWKRVLCAMSLAGGVSAMHFTASTSCIYHLKSYNSDSKNSSRNVQVIVAGVMCGAAAFLVMVFLLLSRSRDRLLRNRSQKISLACAIFDPAGRILVTTEGALPSREITDKYHHRTFDEEFDTSHPVFQWIFRVTHNWTGVGGLIPKMRSHLNAQKVSELGECPSSSQASSIYDIGTYSNYELLFEERFCTAAASIAVSLNVPIEQLGVLYDQIIQTGTMETEDKTSKRKSQSHEPTPMQLEAALRMSIFGKGLVLFLVREVGQEDTDKLLNAGMRFATVHHVARNISHAMQIPQPSLESHLSGLKRYVENLQTTERPGTWLSFFAMIPKPNSKGFDVVVKKDARDQLPDVQLLPRHPDQSQITFLNRLDGQRMNTILALLEDRAGKLAGGLTADELWFGRDLRHKILELIQPFPREWTEHARFWSKQLVAHYSHPLQSRSTVTTMYAFTVIGDMHASIDASLTLGRIPRTFFEVRHRCYAGSPDHALLARDIHQAFAPLFARKLPKRHRKAKLSVVLADNPIARLKKTATGDKRSTRDSSLDHGDEHSSMHELVDKPPHPSDSSRGSERYHTNNWGGILVNSETVVKTDSKQEFPDDGPGALIPMGQKVDVSTAELDVTFANELVLITKQRFLPAAKSFM
ncbi:hypothetical protein DOTSEDRAFT_88624 [Dothistroma septosporum NZE10]|uniref:MHYT domain-containing protein n=1 Tax=Dothistroma septosporum (strain NZE10 / CBS 128990) TaxID=675120 RepID=N1PPY0_DOTSN|nr:hypothetical protein DOTSEDRAFT_88624 [Dothistroma septosporum NZE10]